LPHSPLDQEQKRQVVQRVRRHLLTPMGLRSLSPQDAQYHPEYRGDMYARDKSYHNGTVWAWLIGPFLDAHLAAEEHSQDAREQCRAWLRPLVAQLEEGCVGQLAEVFDGDSPHKPAGCPAQAWSVAEVLRLAVELDL
jgi:glycogen debranching enzyme